MTDPIHVLLNGEPRHLAPRTTIAALLDARIPHSVEKLSGMRKTIARRLSQSMQQAPHIYLTVDIRLDKLLSLRGELNEVLATNMLIDFEADFVFRPSVLPCVRANACMNVPHEPRPPDLAPVSLVPTAVGLARRPDCESFAQPVFHQ